MNGLHARADRLAHPARLASGRFGLPRLSRELRLDLARRSHFARTGTHFDLY
jgi:hypothetical protein